MPTLTMQPFPGRTPPNLLLMAMLHSMLWVTGLMVTSADTVAGGNLGLVPNTDYAWMPVPGTQGVYDFLSDSFDLPIGAKNRDAAIKWLTLCGSKEGQDAFNPVKGSIAARKDSDKSLYGVYLQSAIADWAKDVVVGSLWHGVVANDTWKNQISTDFGAIFSIKMLPNSRPRWLPLAQPLVLAVNRF